MSFGNEYTLGEALGKMLKKMKLDDDVKQNAIMTAWNNIMPESFKEKVTKLTYNKDVLIIFVSSSTLRHELFLQRIQLMNRLNEEVGERYIKQVILK